MFFSKAILCASLLAFGLAAAQDNSTDPDSITGPIPGDDGPGATITEQTLNLTFTGEAAADSLGKAHVVNKCDHPVYLWSVGDSTGSVHTLAANGGKYSETYRSPSTGGGVSMKIHNSKNGGVPPTCEPHRWSCGLTQFEYTLAASESKVYYDISFVNCAHKKDASGCPGHPLGVKVRCNDAGKKTCKPRICDAGAFCPHQAYYNCGAQCNSPDPTQATAMGHDLVYTLCSGSSSSKRDVEGDRLDGDFVDAAVEDYDQDYTEEYEYEGDDE